jgi:coenzyme PQQ precursor peptide PqqA
LSVIAAILAANPARPANPVHENHELNLMMSRMPAGGRSPIMEARSTSRRHTMTWETPQAVEMRFGMEITMYIANR